MCVLQAQFSAGSNALQFTSLQISSSPLSLRQVALSKLALNAHIDNVIINGVPCSGAVYLLGCSRFPRDLQSPVYSL